MENKIKFDKTGRPPGVGEGIGAVVIITPGSIVGCLPGGFLLPLFLYFLDFTIIHTALVY